MKRYAMLRTDWQVTVIVHSPNADAYGLHPRYDLVRHATEFGWGRDNCAASQLALALLCDALGIGNDEMRQHKQCQPTRTADQCNILDDVSSRINSVISTYQLYAKDVLARVPLFQMQWETTSDCLVAWLRKTEAELRR
jgi:hypothetical protein